MANGLSRLARDEGCVARTGSFGIKTEARPKHEGIRISQLNKLRRAPRRVSVSRA